MWMYIHMCNNWRCVVWSASTCVTPCIHTRVTLHASPADMQCMLRFQRDRNGWHGMQASVGCACSPLLVCGLYGLPVCVFVCRLDYVLSLLLLSRCSEDEIILLLSWSISLLMLNMRLPQYSRLAFDLPCADLVSFRELGGRSLQKLQLTHLWPFLVVLALVICTATVVLGLH